MFWLTKGNYALPETHEAYSTALNYPRYRALVVRREAQDLRDWVEEAWELFRHTGAKPTGKPVRFQWDTGALIYTDHLNDENAFNKYRGWNLHRILVEELTEIPKLKWYLRLLGSMRSRKDGKTGQAVIPPQMLSTTNPDGPGSSWVRARFINLFDKKGNPIPPESLVRDPVSGLTRIFIPARLEDNPSIDTEEYDRRLRAQIGERGEGEATYLAWRHGRWDVFEGAFFTEFRPNGPMPNEPDEASHVYDADSVKLAPWWPMAIGVDWGYEHEAATYWGRFNQDTGRTHVTREFVARKMGSRQLGQEIAKRSLEDIANLPDHHIPLFLSHDAFQKDDNTKTKAQLLIDGIQDVLGPNSAHIATLTDREKEMQPAEAWESMQSRFASISGGNCITVHPARQDRANMAAYVREVLHWRTAEQPDPDIDYARKLLLEPDGLVLYEQYMDRFRKVKKEVLPKIKIERNCKKLKQCIASLIYDPDNSEQPLKIDSTGGDPGDDPYDGFCHLLMGMRIVSNRKPQAVFIGERLDWAHTKYGDTPDPAIMRQILDKAHQDYSSQTPDLEPIVFNRLM